MAKFKKISNKIQIATIDNPASDNKIDWVNVQKARKKEVEFLRKEYGFDLKQLKASTASQISQRPVMIDEGKYIFLILHFPVFENGIIKAGEIDFFIGHGFLVTSHNSNITALNDFFNFVKKDQKTLKSYDNESSAILLAEILNKLVKSVYILLDESSQKIDAVEDIIFSGEQKQAVSKILNLRHNIINIRKILQNHKDILKKLVDLESSIVPKTEIKKHYKGLLEHSNRIWEILENQKEMIEVLNNTNESLMNHNLNDIMKTLTIFSVIVFPLTLLAALFGMNTINMPLVEHPYGFWIILSFMLIGSIFMIIYFKKKNWLK